MRKAQAKKLPLAPDPKFQDKLVTRFVNNLMWQGKKSGAYSIFYDALDKVTKISGEEGYDVWKKALANVTPGVEVKSRRIGGATFQIPAEVRADRRHCLRRCLGTIRGQWRSRAVTCPGQNRKGSCDSRCCPPCRVRHAGARRTSERAARTIKPPRATAPVVWKASGLPPCGGASSALRRLFALPKLDSARSGGTVANRARYAPSRGSAAVVPEKAGMGGDPFRGFECLIELGIGAHSGCAISRTRSTRTTIA